MPDETFIKIKLTDSSWVTLQPGQTVMLAADQANQLIADGHAEPVEEE